MRSRIKTDPYCVFEGCESFKAIGCGKYCFKHRQHDPGFKRKEDKKQAKKDGDKLRISFGVGSSFVQNSAAVEKQALENWFRQCAIELDKNPHCQNCGRPIGQKYYRAATAHILPKRKEFGFPSIATHPSNKLFLGAGCGCHDLYDRTWEDASKMKIWPVAVEIVVVELYLSIDPAEHKNIPDILWIEIEKVHGERK